MKNKYKLIDNLVYIIVAIFFFVSFLCKIDFDKNIFVYLTSFLIGLSSYILFIRDNSFLSINKIICIYLFLFAFLAPVDQYNAGTSFWGLQKFGDDDYLLANILIILFMVLYFFVQKTDILKKDLLKSTNAKKSDIKLNDVAAVVMILVSIGCFIFLIITNSLIETEEDSLDSGGSIISFIFKIIRFFPIASLMIYIILSHKKSLCLSRFANILFVLVNVIISLVVFNPVAGTLSRYLLFGTYLIIFSLLLSKCKLKSLLLLGVFVGFGVLIPTFNYFKDNLFQGFENIKITFVDFTHVDYDAHYMFMVALKYVKEEGFLNFLNIISSIFCYMPRSIWTGKLLPSGQLLTEHYGAFYTNVSCPIYAEFYLALGNVGMIFLTVIFSKLIKFLQKGAENGSVYLLGVNAIVLGLMIIFMRGSMLPISTFILALIVTYTIVYFIVLIFDYASKRVGYAK